MVSAVINPWQCLRRKLISTNYFAMKNSKYSVVSGMFLFENCQMTASALKRLYEIEVINLAEATYCDKISKEDRTGAFPKASFYC